MKHLLAHLVLRPLLWLFDLGIAAMMAEPGRRLKRYREERRRSRAAWCWYEITRQAAVARHLTRGEA